MIDINSLKTSDVGRWVEYFPYRGREGREEGRIKSWNDKFVFVVYNCGDRWDEYQNFTAAATLPNELNFIEKEKIKMKDMKEKQASTVSRMEEKIIAILRGTNRPGIEDMISYLQDEGFFKSPASTKFHSSYPGGLAQHSLRVFELLMSTYEKFDLEKVSAPGQRPLPLRTDNIIIAALLHDICKVGAYIGDKAPYKWNKGQPEGHALLSIERIKAYIELEEIEELMIKFHMGVYGLREFYEEGSWEFKTSAEYPLRGDHSKDECMTKEESQAARYGQSLRNAYYHNPVCFWMFVADMQAVAEEKAAP